MHAFLRKSTRMISAPLLPALLPTLHRQQNQTPQQRLTEAQASAWCAAQSRAVGANFPSSTAIYELEIIRSLAA
jgi:hypothetical protein